MSAKLIIKAKIDLQGIIDVCNVVPEILDLEPEFDLTCTFNDGAIGCMTIEEVMEIVRGIIKRKALAEKDGMGIPGRTSR